MSDSYVNSDFDGNIHTAWEFELHQSIDSLCSCAIDVDQTLIRAQFELLAAFLIDESGAIDCENALMGRQGNWTADDGACRFHCLYDLLGRLVDEIVIVRFQFDSDFLAHIFGLT